MEACIGGLPLLGVKASTLLFNCADVIIAILLFSLTRRGEANSSGELAFEEIVLMLVVSSCANVDARRECGRGTGRGSEGMKLSLFTFVLASNDDNANFPLDLFPHLVPPPSYAGLNDEFNFEPLLEVVAFKVDGEITL